MGLANPYPNPNPSPNPNLGDGHDVVVREHFGREGLIAVLVSVRVRVGLRVGGKVEGQGQAPCHHTGAEGAPGR